MKAVCINACTIPGRGLVPVGEEVEFDSTDEKKHPYLKHFEYEKPKAKAKEGKKADEKKEDI